MSTDANNSLNRRWIQAFNERDWPAEAACRSADFQAHVPSTSGSLDSAGWDGFLRSFATAFPDSQITVEASISEGDLVATRWTMRGTHRSEFQGVPATGREMVMQGVDFSRVVDGKIAEHWAQFDVMGMMQQLGALPPAT